MWQHFSASNDSLMTKRIFLIILIVSILPLTDEVGWTKTSPPLISHPWLTHSHYDGEAVWFAGTWHGLILLRFDPATREWESFYYPGIRTCCGNVVIFEETRVIFVDGNGKAFVFQKRSKQWEALTSFNSGYYLGRSGLDKYKIIHSEIDWSEADIKRHTVRVGDYEYIGIGSKIYKSKNNEIVKPFELPTLFVQTLLKYRPHVREHFGYNESKYTFSEVVSGLEQGIGPIVLIGDKIWFGITFYEGEGSEGVGGLGFFDIKTERFGILRAPFLLNCSIAQLESEGNKLWILTNSRGEGGNSRCSGLVSYDLSIGEFTTYTPPQKPYSDLTMLNLIVVGSIFFATTPQGILEFDTKSMEWKFWAVNKIKITKQETEVQSGIEIRKISGPFMKLGKAAKGRMFDLRWAGPEVFEAPPHFEIKSPFTTTGWMSEIAYKNWKTVRNAGAWSEIEALSTPLYADEGLAHVLAYFIAADFEVKERKKDRVKVSTQHGWIKAEDALPVVGLVGKVVGGGVKKEIWQKKRILLP